MEIYIPLIKKYLNFYLILLGGSWNDVHFPQEKTYKQHSDGETSGLNVT